MASRNELVIRANAVGITPSNYPNDSRLEQKVLYLEKNGTTYTETLGVGTLTQSGAATTGDQVTIGNRTYTYRTALTGVKASSTLTNATSFSDTETITINGKSYTMKTTLSSPAQANEILIGANVSASFDNIKSAINGTAGEGSTYGTGTVAHSDVTATTKTGTTLLVVARQFGTGPNSFTTAESGATASWTGTVLSGGTANVPDEIKLTGAAATELDVLKDAINNGAIVGVEGTDYSFGTYAHTQVTATTNGATTQVVASRNAAFDNASIATTDPVDTGTVFSWGAATLASGVRGVIAANTTTYAGSAGVSGDANLV